MHANKPYFNQDDCSIVNTIDDDYRIIIRDDSRIFPADLTKYFEINRLILTKPSTISKINHEITKSSVLFKNHEKNTHIEHSDKTELISESDDEASDDEASDDEASDDPLNDELSNKELIEDDEKQTDTSSRISKKTHHILDSIRDELNSALDN
jgi:hypothetical protein